jgi:hypothetical protein
MCSQVFLEVNARQNIECIWNKNGILSLASLSTQNYKNWQQGRHNYQRISNFSVANTLYKHSVQQKYMQPEFKIMPRTVSSTRNSLALPLKLVWTWQCNCAASAQLFSLPSVIRELSLMYSYNVGKQSELLLHILSHKAKLWIAILRFLWQMLWQ